MICDHPLLPALWSLRAGKEEILVRDNLRDLVRVYVALWKLHGYCLLVDFHIYHGKHHYCTYHKEH